jgi:hypothetical protein
MGLWLQAYFFGVNVSWPAGFKKKTGAGQGTCFSGLRKYAVK